MQPSPSVFHFPFPLFVSFHDVFMRSHRNRIDVVPPLLRHRSRLPSTPRSGTDGDSPTTIVLPPPNLKIPSLFSLPSFFRARVDLANAPQQVPRCGAVAKLAAFRLLLFSVLSLLFFPRKSFEELRYVAEIWVGGA